MTDPTNATAVVPTRQLATDRTQDGACRPSCQGKGPDSGNGNARRSLQAILSRELAGHPVEGADQTQATAKRTTDRTTDQQSKGTTDRTVTVLTFV